jgi:predicted PurR-regulated permease PerM
MKNVFHAIYSKSMSISLNKIEFYGVMKLLSTHRNPYKHLPNNNLMGFGIFLSFLLLLVIVAIVVHYSRKINKLQQQAQSMFSQWVQQHADEIRKQIEQSTETKYKAELDKWKLQLEEQIRRDAITKSINTLLGRIGEEFAPLLIAEKYGVKPKGLSTLRYSSGLHRF